jgi:hypothetical protein
MDLKEVGWECVDWVPVKMAVFWVVAPCSLMEVYQAMTYRTEMEAANTSETSADFYQTTHRNNPEGSHLHTCRRENLKSHLDSCGSG